MPAVFNLWNLYATAGGACELDVTMAEAFQLHQGSPEWVALALAQLGVQATGLTYTLTRSRCFYYSSYPEDREWRDRWPLCWTIHVTGVPAGAPRENHLSTVPQGFDRTDRTATEEYDEGTHDRTALLLSDHAADLPTVTRHVATLVQAARDQLASVEPEVAIRSFGAGLHQIRLLLSGVKMVDDCGALDALAAETRRLGGGANWHDRDGWPRDIEVTDAIRAWQDEVRGMGLDSTKER